MRRSYILRLIASIILILWLTRNYLFLLIQIDFATTDIAHNFKNIWLILFPLAIILFIISYWKDFTWNTKRKFTLIVSAFISMGVILILNFFSGICEWEFSEPLYKNRYNNTEIRFHTLDCGATDGDPTSDLVTTYKVGSYLMKYSKISRNQIDEKEWIKLDGY